MQTERNHGIRRLLSYPGIYQFLMNLLGPRRSREWLLSHHYRVESGMTIVDVGCGPARLRPFMPTVLDYYGFDPNADYIDSARRNMPGEFLVGTMVDFMERHGATLAGKVDLVMCSGVLHHVNDRQMDEILDAALRLLCRSGRFAALEPVFLAVQDPLSRWVVRRDRGTSVLDDLGWRQLLDRHFPRAQVQITTGLIRIPYTHALLTGWAS